MAEGEDVLAKMGQDLFKESYGDLVKPTAKDMGEALSGIFKAVTFYPRYWAIISDISLEEKVGKFKEKLAKNVEVIPPELKVLPSPSILGPSVQALEYAILDDSLSEMFANLVGSSMNLSEKLVIHPSFVEMIKQMNSDEAKIMILFSKESTHPVVDIHTYLEGEEKYSIFRKNESMIPEDSGCDYVENGASYLTNLIRLGLIERQENAYIHGENAYERLKQNIFEQMKNIASIFPQGTKYRLQIGGVRLTELGSNFVQACVLDQAEKASRQKEHSHE
jgi:hypothetical protein